jgi:hypothetical protein
MSRFLEKLLNLQKGRNDVKEKILIMILHFFGETLNLSGLRPNDFENIQLRNFFSIRTPAHEKD